MDKIRTPRYLRHADCVLVCKALEEVPACSAILARESTVFDEILDSASFERNENGQRKLPVNEEAELVQLLANVLHGTTFELPAEVSTLFELARVAHTFRITAVLKLVDSSLCAAGLLGSLLVRPQIFTAISKAYTYELEGLVAEAARKLRDDYSWVVEAPITDVERIPVTLLSELLRWREEMTKAATLEARQKFEDTDMAALSAVRELQKSWNAAVQFIVSHNFSSSDCSLTKKEASSLRADIRWKARESLTGTVNRVLSGLSWPT